MDYYHNCRHQRWCAANFISNRFCFSVLAARQIYLTGLRTGSFAKAVFADSLAGLFNAAPLLMATKPWYYASWRLVFTIIGFQVSCTGVCRAQLKYQKQYGSVSCC